MKAHILIVDDEENLVFFLKGALEDLGYTVSTSASVGNSFKQLQENHPDLLLLDLNLPDGTGLDLFRKMQEIGHTIPTIIITAHASVKSAIEAIRLGVDDYIVKPFEIDEILILIEQQLNKRKLYDHLSYFRDKLIPSYKGDFFISDLPEMRKIQDLSLRLAHVPECVILIEGPSGSGKEMLAHFIHDNSEDANAPFIEINCASLSENLLESELFGHEAGAFTDAKAKKTGLIELANGGTLFLDEIGEMNSALQAKLLRVIETRRFKRLGGVRDIHVTLRIIAATNRDIKKMVDEGRFRQDLYFRLNKFHIVLPPLKERREELLKIAELLLKRINAKLNLKIKNFSPQAREFILNYDWPGNFRELHNAIERAAILCDGHTITLDLFPCDIDDTKTFQPSLKLLQDQSLRAFVDQTEKQLLSQALQLADNNQVAAARILKEPRHIIRYLIRKHGLKMDGEN